jgi:hypothetical protein
MAVYHEQVALDKPTCAGLMRSPVHGQGRVNWYTDILLTPCSRVQAKLEV